MTDLHEDNMLARANKIKAMFSVQLKEQATLPGISREKTGKSYEELHFPEVCRDAVYFVRECPFLAGLPSPIDDFKY